MSASTQNSIEVTFNLPTGRTRFAVSPEIAHATLAILRGVAQTPDPLDALAWAERVAQQAPGGPHAMSLRVYRRNKGLTQRALAAATGMQQAHVSAMEKGKRPVTPAMAKRLAKVLDCDWQKLASA